MHTLSLGILSAASIAICSAATAQTTTCSKLKAECDRGVASREAQAVSQCPAAFKHCLKNRGMAHIRDRRTYHQGRQSEIAWQARLLDSGRGKTPSARLRPCQDIANRHCVPLSPSRRFDASRVERISDFARVRAPRAAPLEYRRIKGRFCTLTI